MWLAGLLISLLLCGCETLPEPPLNGAIYRTANTTYVVENTTPEEFCNQMVHNPTILEGKYRDEDDITELEKLDDYNNPE